jgi:hypothetical protein
MERLAAIIMGNLNKYKHCASLQDTPKPSSRFSRINQYKVMCIAMRGTWTAQILVNSNPIIQASIKSLAC